jgi:hypothetical protein
MASLQTGDGVTVVALRTDVLFDSLGNSPTDALPVAIMNHKHERRVHLGRPLRITIER